MAQDDKAFEVDFDRALEVGAALDGDKLGRRAFAESIVSSLRRVNPSGGFVLSVEGGWGSGKTSILAMIEDLLRRETETHQPIIVHFNPWLIGSRDALLKQFLSEIAACVGITDHAGNGKKVAEELKAYANVFDVVKFIPGAEPAASIIKALMQSAGSAADAVAGRKESNIEDQKNKVAKALRDLNRVIVVFIDDIDRLFPTEIFEIVRIVKAVGDLPNVAYVLSFDPAYVSEALERASIPKADAYLEKIVQVRMPIPVLSPSARVTLVDEALTGLGQDVLKPYFPDGQDRLSWFYFSGLRHLIEQPRDVVKIFNVAKMIEPPMRGEIVFADILGLASLIAKAPAVFDLLRKHPQWFVGPLPKDEGFFKKTEEILKEGDDARNEAISKSQNSQAIRRIVEHLFPRTKVSMLGVRDVEVNGCIASPTRLAIALQAGLTHADVSLQMALRYLEHQNNRVKIENTLTAENCAEFLEMLAEVAEAIEGRGISDLESLCISVARMVDTDKFAARQRNRGFMHPNVENIARRTVNRLVRIVDPSKGAEIAASIVNDQEALTLAAELLRDSYLVTRKDDDEVICRDEAKEILVDKFADNAKILAANGGLMKTCNPGFALWILANFRPGTAPEIFSEIKKEIGSLDEFALEMLKHGVDSRKGQTYSLPKDVSQLEAYCSPDQLKEHATARLADPTMGYPARAAWLAVVNGDKRYGKDGSVAER